MKFIGNVSPVFKEGTIMNMSYEWRDYLHQVAITTDQNKTESWFCCFTGSSSTTPVTKYFVFPTKKDAINWIEETSKLSEEN